MVRKTGLFDKRNPVKMACKQDCSVWLLQVCNHKQLLDVSFLSKVPLYHALERKGVMDRFFLFGRLPESTCSIHYRSLPDYRQGGADYV
jgi:hypothetical protein